MNTEEKKNIKKIDLRSIEKIRRINLKPDDIFVVIIKESLPTSRIKAISERLHRKLHRDVLVIRGDVEIGVISRKKIVDKVETS